MEVASEASDDGASVRVASGSEGGVKVSESEDDGRSEEEEEEEMANEFGNPLGKKGGGDKKGKGWRRSANAARLERAGGRR